MDPGSAKLHESRQNGSLVGNTLIARYWRISVAIAMGILTLVILYEQRVSRALYNSNVVSDGEATLCGWAIWCVFCIYRERSCRP